MELQAYIELLDKKPTFLALNETFLDKSVEIACFSGYSLVSRRDRCDGREKGGIALFCLKEFENFATLVHFF